MARAGVLVDVKLGIPAVTGTVTVLVYGVIFT